MIPKLEENYASAGSRLLLFDYDGTLTAIKPTPPEGRPTPALLELLKQLSDDAKNKVVIISGRDHETLDGWLGKLPLDFASEHGLYIKERGKPWHITRPANDSWKHAVRPVLEKYVRQIKGAAIEEKTVALVWHYRLAAEPEQAAKALAALKAELVPLLTRFDLAALDGKKVLDIKPAGVHKGAVARHWLNMKHWDFILAAGDDTTDEDIFKEMPPGAFTIKIGGGQSAARSRLKSPAVLRTLLKKLVAS